MHNSNLSFFNSYQGAAGVYISFGTLNKFYLKFGGYTSSYYAPSSPVIMSIISEKNTILFKTNVLLTPDEKSIIVITGSGNDVGAVKIPSHTQVHRPDRAYIRFINLSTIGPVSLVQKGNSIFNQVEFCEKTNYILSSPGKYLFTIKAPAVTKTAEVTVEAGDYKTIFFIGNRALNRAVILHEYKA